MDTFDIAHGSRKSRWGGLSWPEWGTLCRVSSKFTKDTVIPGWDIFWSWDYGFGAWQTWIFSAFQENSQHHRAVTRVLLGVRGQVIYKKSTYSASLIDCAGQIARSAILRANFSMPPTRGPTWVCKQFFPSDLWPLSYKLLLWHQTYNRNWQFSNWDFIIFGWYAIVAAFCKKK